ncbi:hypothetical protein [Priestia megaterium]|uniref:hypothetical protein n=1 Tax=Priestia megaterium TaxID=1404 RepID=UPI00159BD5D5|nr:hypothetical protein [Priestia megaterium]
MVGGQGEDSCGLIGRPRKAKSCTASNSGRASSPDHVSRLFVFKFDSCSYVSPSFSYFMLASITNILPIYY